MFQIAIGSIPEERALDMLTVQNWCNYQGYTYKLITELDEEFNGINNKQ